jgi:hypothetical protein
MKKRISFILFVAFAGFFTGCGDDDKKDDPTPETGTVTGTISPANSASKVYLIVGTDTIKGTPTAAGTYELTDVKVGTYKLAFKATSAYVAPAPTDVTVTARQTTNVPVVTFATLPPNGLMSVEIDGVTHSRTPSNNVSGSFAEPYIISNNFSTYDYTVQIRIPHITGPGTFNITNSDLVFSISDGRTNYDYYTWYPGSSGTLTITSYNSATKRGNGTFSFVAANTSGDPNATPKTKAGVNGVLTNVKLNP